MQYDAMSDTASSIRHIHTAHLLLYSISGWRASSWSTFGACLGPELDCPGVYVELTPTSILPLDFSHLAVDQNVSRPRLRAVVGGYSHIDNARRAVCRIDWRWRHQVRFDRCQGCLDSHPRAATDPGSTISRAQEEHDRPELSSDQFVTYLRCSVGQGDCQCLQSGEGFAGSYCSIQGEDHMPSACMSRDITGLGNRTRSAVPVGDFVWTTAFDASSPSPGYHYDRRRPDFKLHIKWLS